MPHRRRSLVVAGAAAPLFFATPARGQAGGYAAEIANIEPTERRVTLKGSMGQLTVRVTAGVVLDAFKPGDKVLVTFGQDGTEPVITRIELAKM
jgi:Cu/Ag efflux protein CusF